jgi:tol-pal system protein YbgF
MNNKKKGIQMCKKYSIIIIGIIIGILAGCASTVTQLESETLLPEIDVVQVKEYSEEALKLAQEAKIDIQMVNTKLSDVDNKLVVLSEEVASVSLAKIEELENRISLLIEAFKDLHEKMAAIEILPQIRIVKPKNKKSKLPAVFSPSAPGTMITSSEYDQYQLALRTFDKRTYDKAGILFADLINKYPDGEYTDKAQYWIGECFYAKADYANAIVSFNKVLKYKNTSKADDAQLKLGLSYLRMGKSDLAIDEFKRLINRYPGSEYISRAEKYLSEVQVAH